MVRAAALDREMLGALGTNVGWLYTGMFALGSFLAGLGGALVTPIKSVVPGMDVEIIVEAFIVVVIGGLGSLWGTFLGALIYGQVLAFGILIFPRFSIFAAFVLMAVILIVRPWGLFGRPIDDETCQRASRWTLDRVHRAGAGHPVARLALLHLPRDRHRHPGAVRDQPEPAARLRPASCRSATPPTSASAPTPAPSS